MSRYDVAIVLVVMGAIGLEACSFWLKHLDAPYPLLGYREIGLCLFWGGWAVLGLAVVAFWLRGTP